MLDLDLSSTDWMEGAACAGKDSKFFDYSENLTRKENAENMREGVQYCEFCPAKEACLEEADRVDVQWTVRGGLLPLILSPGRTDQAVTPRVNGPQRMSDADWMAKQKKNPKYLLLLEQSKGKLRVCRNHHEVPALMKKCSICSNAHTRKRR